MDKFRCPICGKNECKQSPADDFIYTNINCKLGYEFAISDEIMNMKDERKDKLYNLIYEYLIHNPSISNLRERFYYDPENLNDARIKPNYINLASALESYPSNFIEQANRALMNFAVVYPKYGQLIGTEYNDIRAVYYFGKNANYEVHAFLDLMAELGYLAHKDVAYVISANGWKKINELESKQQEVNQGFIAMKFGDETNEIRKAFKNAIEEAGYAVSIIDEKEHNNQIVPEIFYEISRSKFIVVDITYPNYGAYYEAGYAQGLNKQVIVCCKKKVFENQMPHFDISQKSMVIWETYEELKIKLKRRIEATVK